jgi:hypothetical protein
VNVPLRNVNTRKIKPVKSKKRNLSFCLLFILLLTCLLISPAAAKVEWKITPSNPTVGDTLKIKGTASPGESLKAEVSFEKEIPVFEGKYNYLLENVKVPEGSNNRFTVKADGVKNLHVGVKKLAWINLNSEASEGVATISQGHVPALTYDKILIDGDAANKKSSVNLIVTASQTLKANSKGKFEYSYDTSSMPAGEFTIQIGDSDPKTIELGSEKPKKNAAKPSITIHVRK